MSDAYTAVMRTKVLATIHRHHLFRPDMHVVLAVSGGLDSMALLHLLHVLRVDTGVNLSALHVHHGLRARDADKDAELVNETCSRLGLPCYLKRIDVEKRRTAGVSLEMAARQARLEAFRDVCRDIQADVVATAHHRDDQVETILMRLLTGCGLDGLAAMDYRSEPLPGLHIVRPLLDLTRSELEAYARDKNIHWREDRSNRDTAITRNRIRRVILPFLARQGFAGAGDALFRLAGLARDENQLLEDLTGEWLEACRSGKRLRRARLLDLPVAAQRRVLRRWMAGHGLADRKLDFARLESMRLAISGAGNGKMAISRDILLVWRHGWVSLERDIEVVAKPKLHVHKLNVPGFIELKELGLRVEVTRAIGFKRLVTPPGKYPAVSYLRREAQPPELHIRSRKAGDRIHPAGMKGSMSLKEMFINLKIPVHRRPAIPLVTAGDQVICVPGYRVARGWEVPDAKSPSWRIEVTKLRVNTD
jgi:tRNA(Ile)-lysidine synthase